VRKLSDTEPALRDQRGQPDAPHHTGHFSAYVPPAPTELAD
jgi:hypothetical protein